MTTPGAKDRRGDSNTGPSPTSVVDGLRTMETLIGAQVGPYRLGAVIGRGPCGAVFRARDERRGRRVALKVIEAPLAGGPEALDRMVRAASDIGRLRHPNVIPILDQGMDDGVAYIAMPLVGGGDLRARLRLEGPLDPARALDLLEQAAAGLDAAHDAGVVHGNVKPSNLLIDRDRPEHLFVADFGTAADPDVRAQPGSSQAPGARAYRAPEFERDGPSEAGDVFSLGCVLHEVLTGVPAFSGKTLDDLLDAQRAPVRPSVVSLRPGLPPAIDEVIQRSTSPTPADRPGSCSELVAEARQALEVEERSSAVATDRGDQAVEDWRAPERATRRLGWPGPGSVYRNPYRRSGVLGWIGVLVLVVGAAALLVMADRNRPGAGRQLTSEATAVQTSASPAGSPTASAAPSPAEATPSPIESSPSPPPPPPPPPTEGVVVQVLNGAAIDGLATLTGDKLIEAGFTVLAPGNAPPADLTTVYFVDGYEESARYLVDQFLPGARALPSATEEEAPFHILVILGADYEEVLLPPG